MGVSNPAAAAPCTRPVTELGVKILLQPQRAEAVAASLNTIADDLQLLHY
jgi:hypothetical protein